MRALCTAAALIGSLLVTGVLARPVKAAPPMTGNVSEFPTVTALSGPQNMAVGADGNKLGPVPGAAGDAVIDGHLDWWTDGPAVFWKLNEIRPGAEIDIIDAGGAKLQFKVTTLNSLHRSGEPAGMFTTTGTPMLTLYTCAGVWEPFAETYSERLFVEAVPLR
jgi:sortase (surface protein transpeptidase)